METVVKADYKIIYEGKDVTRDFAPILNSIEFTDTLEGKAGSLTIELSDPEKRFLGSWFPKSTDKIQVWMGDTSQPLLDAQKFWIDEVEIRGGRDGYYCTIRAMSTEFANIIKGSIRKAAAKTLSDLANRVANDLGLKLKGSISGKIYGNQTHADLVFLSAQAKRNGYIVKVENGYLVIHKYSDLYNETSFDLSLKDVVDYTYTNKAIGKFKKCTVMWYAAKKKQTFKGSSTVNIAGGGEATIYEHVDSNNEAVERAKSWLEDKNKQEDNLEITINGDVRVLAGIIINVKDAGDLNGKRVVSESTHRIERDKQYTTTFKLQK